MVTIKIPGMKDVKLSAIEFNLLVSALKVHIKWGFGGMFGDGTDITDKADFARAERIISKLNY